MQSMSLHEVLMHLQGAAIYFQRAHGVGASLETHQWLRMSLASLERGYQALVEECQRREIATCPLLTAIQCKQERLCSQLFVLDEPRR